MAIELIAPKFKTSDGREFATQAEAERHERVIEANRAFEAAQRELMVALAETQRTADGVLFSFRRWTYYYPLPWRLTPGIHPVHFDVWNCRFSETDGVFKLHYPDDRGQWTTYRISELYASQDAAEAALLTAWEERVETERAGLETLRAKVGWRKG